MVLINTVSYSQIEPKDINPNDVMEKVDRSDIETVKKSNGRSDIAVPKFEMPKIEFSTSIKSKEKTETNKINAVENKIKKSIVKLETQVPKKSEIEIVIIEKPILLNEFKINDKIVVLKGNIYIYRKFVNEIKQYTYLGKLDIKSKALTLIDSNSYYVKDLTIFIRDSKKYNKPKVKKEIAKKHNNVRKRKRAKSKSQQLKINKSLAVAMKKTQFSETELLERKEIEKKFNNGNIIKKTINLIDLSNDDTLYILGNYQIVTRKISFSSNKNKFWLAEKPDLSEEMFKKLKENKYKIVK